MDLAEIASAFGRRRLHPAAAVDAPTPRDPKPELFWGKFPIRRVRTRWQRRENRTENIRDKAGFIGRAARGARLRRYRGAPRAPASGICRGFKPSWFHTELGDRDLFVRDITHEGRRERFVLLIDTHFCLVLGNQKLPAPFLRV